MEEVLVDILVATYNGERFLEKQLDSLLQQTHQNIKIYIRDDGSTDRTTTIIKQYQQKDKRIYLIEDDKGNLGVVQNFNELATYSTANYCCFCDQDDIWMPNKIELSLSTLQQLEQQHINVACMVYSDLKTIDEEDNIITKSFWKQEHLAPTYFIFNRLLIQSIPHGCTIMCNNILLQAVFPIPQQAMLHDHWMALYTTTIGKAQAIITPTVLLRNHRNNVSRKQESVKQRVLRMWRNLLSKQDFNFYLQQRIVQAKAFLQRYEKQMPETHKKTVQQFLLLAQTKGMARKRIYITNKFYRTTLIATLKMLWNA